MHIIPLPGTPSGSDEWTDGNTTSNSDIYRIPLEHNMKYGALFLLLFPLLTVFGNCLVCLSIFREKSLHTVTNYFIFSLAVADIMVAILVMPGAVYVEVSWTSRVILRPRCVPRTDKSQDSVTLTIKRARIWWNLKLPSLLSLFIKEFKIPLNRVLIILPLVICSAVFWGGKQRFTKK